MRLFVAVDPGADVVRRIEHVLMAIRPKAPSAKWVKADSLHLTLAFLGERPEEDAPKIGEALSQVAAAHAPFELHFKGGGGFGRPSRPKVLWAGCEGDTDALAALQKAVEEALVPLGFVPDRRDFSAHLTLARARDTGGDLGLSRCVQGLETEDFGASTIREVVLYESRLSPAGASYTAVHKARLRPSPS